MRSEDIGSVLPWSPEAEQRVLGALLVDNRAWDQVGDLITASDFYDAGNAKIYTTAGALICGGKVADAVSVYAELQRLGHDEAVGGLSYLGSLAQEVASARGARRHAEIVRERALMRQLQDAAGSVSELATRTGLEVGERISQAQAVMQALDVATVGGREPVGVDMLAVDLIDRIQARAENPGADAVPTGIPGLDRLIGGGWKAGKVVVVAARPSIGKSSLSLQFAIDAALDQQVGAGFFSQEMEKTELMDRAAARLGRIDLGHIITGRLTNDEWPRFTEVVEKLRFLSHLCIDDQPALTLRDIQSKARMLVRKHKLKVLVIDYIQLCAGANAEDKRHTQIEAISRGLKVLAKQLGITIIVLSQLGRKVEERASGRPVLADLKESGAIEEDADIVLLLSRHSKTDEGFQVICCDIAKNRQGPVSTLFLGFEGPFQVWAETIAPAEPRKPAYGRRHTDEV